MLSATDPDAGATFTYSIQSQSVNAGAAETFAISGNTLVVSDGSLNVDNTVDQYTLGLRATDEHGAYVQETVYLTLGMNSNGGDSVTGNSGDDIIYALSSNTQPNANQRDVINAGSGNDQVFGQGGKDTLNGQDGSDLLDGGAGDDSLSGGNGNDILVGARATHR